MVKILATRPVSPRLRLPPPWLRMPPAPSPKLSRPAPGRQLLRRKHRAQLLRGKLAESSCDAPVRAATSSNSSCRGTALLPYTSYHRQPRHSQRPATLSPRRLRSVIALDHDHERRRNHQPGRKIDADGASLQCVASWETHTKAPLRLVFLAFVYQLLRDHVVRPRRPQRP